MDWNRRWNRLIHLAPKIKMAAGTPDDFLNCFEDVISLLNDGKEEESSISRPFIGP